MTDYHATLVPALDALIGDPSILMPEASSKKKADLLLIPAHYIRRVTSFRDEISSRGEASQVLIGYFAKILEKIHYSKDNQYVCDNGMRIEFVDEKHYVNRAGDNNASLTLAAAQYYKESNETANLAILTGDNSMCACALMGDIDVAHINPEKYTGRRKLVLPLDLYTAWYKFGYLTIEQIKEYFPNEKPLLINEFVEFEVDETTAPKKTLGSRIGRFEIPRFSNEPPCLQCLHYIDDLPNNIKPRTAGQAMLLEALLAPVDEIPIVISPSIFGTGKTFCAVAVGTYLTSEIKKHRYDQVFVVPRDSSLGKEIGFLPGDERDKTISKAMPIVDNIKAYVKTNKDKTKGGMPISGKEVKIKVKDILDNQYEFVPIISMGGRSIADSWIIYDEAQDMERFQIKQLMERIGDGSKMIIIGDPDQVYNTHMNAQSNGLSYAATKMAGSPYAVVISLDEEEITRSTAAQEIAKRLK